MHEILTTSAAYYIIKPEDNQRSIIVKVFYRIISLALAFVMVFYSVSCNGTDADGSDMNGGDSSDNGKNDEPLGNYQPWNFYPEGYTAGDWYHMRQPGAEMEIWWLETYEELLDAIALLQSHGSTFKKMSFFAYDGDLFDTKYSVRIRQYNSTEKIKFGDDPFDRYAVGVEIETYAFFEDVTIDELNYGSIYNYHVYSINATYFDKTDNMDSMEYEYEWELDGVESWATNRCIIYLNGERWFCITRQSINQEDNLRMPDECVDALLDSLKTINKEGEVK